MEFKVGKNTVIRFNKGFKPKSLTLFLKVYSKYGSKDELNKIYDKLNGNSTKTNRKPRKAKRKSDNQADIPSGKEG